LPPARLELRLGFIERWRAAVGAQVERLAEDAMQRSQQSAHPLEQRLA
jgi:hypothetical protein